MKAWIIRKALPALLTVALLGIAAPTADAVGTLSPASHDFGEQTVGTTSAPSFFTLSNFCSTQDPIEPTLCGGSTALNPAASTTGDFAQTNSCPMALIPIFFSAPATCTITVTFTPTAAGSRTGTLVGATGLSSSLSGTGIPAPTTPTTPTTPSGPGAAPPNGPGIATSTCKGVAATIVGTEGNDVRKATSSKDVIAGLGGNDTLSGLGGNDLIYGGAGKDTLKGGKGKDTLLGQGGKDALKGGGGKDVCTGGKANDSAPLRGREVDLSS